MDARFFSLSMVWTITLVCFHGAPVKATNSGLRLDVPYNVEPNSQLVINCSLDARSTDLTTLASLTIFGSRPYGGVEDFDQLATVDMWSNEPKLGNELVEADVSIAGRIEEGPSEISVLILSWNSPTKLYRNTYKCVANGITRKGEATSLASTVKLEQVGGGGCCHKMDSVSSHLQHLAEVTQETASDSSRKVDLISSRLQRLTEVVQETANISKEVVSQVQGQDHKMLELESKLDAVHLTTRFLSTLMTIDRTKYDVSPVYKETLYLATRQPKVFNIVADNEACQQQGGYLAEIDDDEESRFVFNFAKAMGGSDIFMTGGNDIDEEGKFVFFHSKKSVPQQLTWLRGQPDDYKRKEDCMHFWITRGGLNDTPCTSNSKYICEVPLRAQKQ
ncbi:C-type lectin [Elysia marginata]|uniref:C-type lectin n=1 Tax=Elysia marginata TaxID=1093978 RepID=A0AAV4GNY4_9GAST|nr:C-type lectin [Elysia marginata]